MISASDPEAQGDELMDKIKPVAWANKCATEGYLYGIEYGPDGEDTRSYAVEFGDEAVPLYDQSAIDAMRAEVEAANERAEYWRSAKSSDFVRDAQRFRWVSNRKNARVCFLENGDWPPYPDDLAAAIDAAMKDAAP